MDELADVDHVRVLVEQVTDDRASRSRHRTNEEHRDGRSGSVQCDHLGEIADRGRAGPVTEQSNHRLLESTNGLRGVSVVDGNLSGAALNRKFEKSEELVLGSSELDFVVFSQSFAEVDLMVIHVFVEPLLSGDDDGYEPIRSAFQDCCRAPMADNSRSLLELFDQVRTGDVVDARIGTI
jgi:hypothetical protein